MATVLLIEDEPGVSRMLATVLRAVRHTVLQATTIAESVVVLQETDIDVVVSDIGLPDGSGARLVPLCRMLRPRAPVLFVTGWAGDLPAALAEVPEWRILAKPFRPGELIEAVQRALEEAGDGGSHLG